MPSRPELSIVVPAYAEAPLIVQSLHALAASLSARPSGATEVIVVVAESDDGTFDLARECMPLFEQCSVIDAGPRAGKGRDVRLGMLAARGRFRLFMDADLATPLRHLDELAPYIAVNTPLVIGARDLWHAHRRLSRRLVATGGNLAIRGLLLPGLFDTQCGFKMFRADVGETLFAASTVDGWGFDLEILAMARRLGHDIAVLHVDDWSDPKPAGRGLGTDRVSGSAIEVFAVLLQLRRRMGFRPRGPLADANDGLAATSVGSATAHPRPHRGDEPAVSVAGMPQ
jgi:dolichyl-phosphate beta-glucosyltransferase